VEQLLSDVEHVCEGDERLISRAELLIFDDDLLSSDVEQL
jgi:hypothetical protein